MTPFAQNVVPLHSSENDDNDRSIESDSAWDAEPEAKQSTRGGSPDEVDLDELIAKLKALAAKAQQSAPSHRSNTHLAMIAAAIALSLTSGAVTAQYLVPGHSRAAIAPSKSFANATPRAAVPIGNVETLKR